MILPTLGCDSMQDEKTLEKPMGMNHQQSRMQQCGAAMIVGTFALLLITACTSDQPKPLPHSTPDQVRGHGDRAFEKLKQEEQERATRPPTSRY
jgi:hypothetical protein